MSRYRTVVALSAALLPLAAQAHPGHALHATFMQGLLHPLTGWDHLMVLLSLGLLAAGRRPRLTAACGALLIAALGGGAAVGLAWPSAAFIEPMLIVTVIASLALLAYRQHVSAGVLLSLSMGFTFIHGIAHGQEAPAGDLVGYFAGFTLAGMALFGAGLLFAAVINRVQKGAPITSRQPGKSPASR